MDANHHIPGEILAAYATGNLPEAYSLVVACHVSLCDTCRTELTAYEFVGGDMLERADAAELGPAALDATLALIDAAPEVRPARSARIGASVFPGPLQDYAGDGPDAVRWRPVGGGVKQAVLDCAGGPTARLLYIPGGTAVPEHGHGGLELTLVLQGAFSDSVARFDRGDVEVGDGDLEHQPVAAEGEACICLAATDAPLRFKSLLPRIFQPFLGI